MSGPLEGVKVLECGIWMQAPYTTRILGDLGADVIKVEDRISGDPMRGVLKMQPTSSCEGAHNLERLSDIEIHNRNKRSIALDLRKDEGRGIIYRLIQKMDVFVHNFRLGVVEKLGIDYETLSRYNSNLIYAHASGFGMKGPAKNQPSFEHTVMARSGWLYHFGGPDMPPLMFRPGIGDDLVGVYVAFAISAALFYRERTGVGQYIDVSALGSMVAAASNTINWRLIYGVEYPRRDTKNTTNPLNSLFKCSDGKWIYLTMMQTDRYWHDLCKVMGIEELEHDPKFCNHQARADNSLELTAIFDRTFNSKSRDEWVKLLEEGGDFIFSAVNSVSDLLTDPQVLENDYITEYEHPSFGITKTIGFPYKFSKTPASIEKAPPEHGEHTEEILQEIGYTWEDIIGLKQSEVII